MNENMYYVEYKNRDFYGFVLAPSGRTVFEIEDLNSMRILIASGAMKHIDDVKGLSEYLKSRKIIENDETIEFAGVFESV